MITMALGGRLLSQKSFSVFTVLSFWIFMPVPSVWATRPCGMHVQDLIQDIQLDGEADFALGFLSPSDAQLRNPGSNQGSICDKVLIYNFKAPRSKPPVVVTIIFHEYYHFLEVMICNTQHVDQVGAKEALSQIPLWEHNPEKAILNQSCQWINPVEHPVFRADAPFFVEIQRHNRSSAIPDRVHLIDQGGAFLYNITYELRRAQSSNAGPPLSFVDVTQVHRVDPCSRNGIPYLYGGKDRFEFRCKCQHKTYGMECQWGPSCSPKDQRALCDNRGTCRAVSSLGDDYYACFCDENYAGRQCIHYTAFPIVSNCFSNACPYCHQLPSGDQRCSCHVGFRPSTNEQCVKDSMDVFLRYEKLVDAPITKALVASEIKNLFSCNEHFQSLDLLKHITIKEDLLQVRLTNISHLDTLTNLSFAKLKNEKVWQGGLNNSCQGGTWDQAEVLATTQESVTTMTSPTEERLNIERQLNFSLIRVRYSNTVIQAFRGTFREDSLDLCCCTTHSDFEFTFLKDANLINKTPFKLGSGETWHSGDIFMDSLLHCICLKFKHVTSDDYGVYTCRVESDQFREEKDLFVTRGSTQLNLEFQPENATVLQGDDVTIICSMVNVMPWPPYPNIMMLPVTESSSHNYSVHLINSRSLSITFVNIQGNVSVVCNASEKLDGWYMEKVATVTVYPRNYPVCEEEIAFGMKWPMAKENMDVKVKCPIYYTGLCERKCTTRQHEMLRAAWQLPDCSQCRRNEIFDILKNFSMFRRGIPSYLPVPERFLKDVDDALRFYYSFLPGEMSYVLRSLDECLSLPSIQYPLEDIHSLLSRIISINNSLTEKDLVVMQRLVKKLPIRYHASKCPVMFFEGDSLAVYFRDSLSIGFSPNISFPLDKTESSLLGGTKRKRSLREEPLQEARNSSKINVLLSQKKEIPQILFVTVFRKPHLFLTHKRRIRDSTLDADEATSDDQRGFGLFPRFGQSSSPLVQVDVYDGNNVHFQLSEMSEITVEFKPCHPANNKRLKCARYLPAENIWVSEGCVFTRSGEKICSCACTSLDGWIGLVGMDVQNPEEREKEWTSNSVIASGCGLAIFSLSLTTLVLLIRCRHYLTRFLPRVVEVLALLMASLLFLYGAMAKPSQDDRMLLLIVISASLALTLSISVTHQVDILHSFSSYRNSSRMGSSAMHPSLLLTAVSSIMAVLLGVILWTIGKVKEISLTHAWLPEGESSSSLTTVVICYIAVLLLLVCVIAAVNWLRSKNSLLISSTAIAEYFLILDLKRHCALAFLKFIYLITSIYQRSSEGQILFTIASISVGFSMLFLYTCENLWLSISSKNSSSGGFNGKHHLMPGKVNDSENCLWSWLFSSSVIYFGLAPSQKCMSPTEDSMEIGGIPVPLWSQNVSPLTKEDNEENKSRQRERFSSLIPMAQNGNSPSSSHRREVSRQKNVTANSEEYLNIKTLIVPIESHLKGCDERIYENGKQSQAMYSNSRVPQAKISPKKTGYLQVQGTVHSDCVSPHYLCMKGHRHKKELKSQKCDHESPSQTFLSDNFPSPSKAKKSHKLEKGRIDPMFDQSNYLKFKTYSLSWLGSDSSGRSTVTLPRYERNRKILSNFSSKVSLFGSKAKRAHRSLASGRAGSSSDYFERSILIESPEQMSPQIKQVFSHESVIKPKDKYAGHKRQHSI